MKKRCAGLIGLVISLSWMGAAQAQEAGLSIELQRLTRAVQDIRTSEALVDHILDYCAQSNPAFAPTRNAVRVEWRDRNLRYRVLEPGLRSELDALAAQELQTSAGEIDDVLRDAIGEVTQAFDDELQDSGHEMRDHVCERFAERIRDGVFDIGARRPEVKAMLDARLSR